MCELCRDHDKPFKSNTHYLTDYIIRTALNEDGVNERGKGIYFPIDPYNPIVEMRFQQNASPERLEELLGRPTTDEENEAAKAHTEFSVDDKFCADCEAKFTAIEERFHPLLKRFRTNDLTGVPELNFNEEESKVVRMFFLLQIWRTAICDEKFNLSEEMMERLRLKIYNQDYEGLEEFALSVTYLETIDDAGNNAGNAGDCFRTTNIVEAIEGANPSLILMNDFYIQLYEDLAFPFESIHGVNLEDDYKDYINYQNPNFRIKVLSNGERNQLLNAIHGHNAPIFVNQHRRLFQGIHQRLFGEPASLQIEDAWMADLTSDANVMTYTTEQVHQKMDAFFRRIYP